MAHFFALLFLVVGCSVHGFARANAAEQSELIAASAVGASTRDATESARWCSTRHDAPSCVEQSALEPETDGERITPEVPSVIRPVFGCKAPVISKVQVLPPASETYTARFATSPVLARAPPRADV